ncbi:MAG: exodeoxyribonuclease V subunit alpha [Burkholderiaceae bacterium]
MTERDDHLLAEGFARHAAQWAAAEGASGAGVAAIARAASALSLAVSAGHVCLLLAALAAARDDASAPRLDVAGWRAALLASGIVGTPDAPGGLPLILDAEDRLYLHRYFDYERRLAARLMRARHAQADAAAGSPALRAQLAALFAGNAARLGGAADWQQLAAALALRGRLTVISGGPGTGKTTTVVNLLACLVALDPDCRIALAAPTGKAAARMTDAIRQRAQHLPAALRDKMPTESSTVHRLLGVTPAGFAHDAARPLAIDALVVDEASMLDLALATQLLEAVPPAARIILLGDKDQLAAVESGAVFAELSVDPSLTDACINELAKMTGTPAAAIVPPPPATSSALQDCAVWFTQTYRFAKDSGIGKLAAYVNAGQAREAAGWLRAGADPDIAWHETAPHAPLEAALREMDAGYAAYLRAVAADATQVAVITDAFAHFRVLCALRDGPRGVTALNATLTRRFRATLQQPGLADGPGASPWFPGRPVLVSTNDYVLRLFNGDIGIALPDARGELLVHFPDATAPGGFRSIAPVRLPRHETAFAMTVHKSQGSEFEGVLVMLPEQRSRVLTRELLYTAITRAKKRVTLVADAPVLEQAIATATVRHSGLLSRLAEEQVARMPGSGAVDA